MDTNVIADDSILITLNNWIVWIAQCLWAVDSNIVGVVVAFLCAAMYSGVYLQGEAILYDFLRSTISVTICSAVTHTSHLMSIAG